jgi:hypothetical protein
MYHIFLRNPYLKRVAVLKMGTVMEIDMKNN